MSGSPWQCMFNDRFFAAPVMGLAWLNGSRIPIFGGWLLAAVR